LPTRWHDPEKDIGNLEPGQSAFQSPDRIVEVIPATPYSWDEIIAAHRAANRTGAAPRPRATAGFNSHRSLRRISN
jgi:hypothetical protein